MGRLSWYNRPFASNKKFLNNALIVDSGDINKGVETMSVQRRVFTYSQHAKETSRRAVALNRGNSQVSSVTGLLIAGVIAASISLAGSVYALWQVSVNL